jgi:mannose/fructose/N-acetylgalactosamine-specific phosphotransferase system component IID
MNDNASAAQPGWQYWVIAVLGTVWNAFGGYDYTMTRTRNMEYLAQMGDAQAMLDWIDTFPIWAQIGWGLGVWGSVLGSVLMLMRSRHAITAFLVSLVGAVVSLGHQMLSDTPAAFDTTANKILPLVIIAIVAGLWWYSKRAAGRGWLK